MSAHITATDRTEKAVPATDLPQAEPPARARRHRIRIRPVTLLTPLGSLGAAIGVWYAATYLLLSPDRRFLVPPPHQVLTVSFLDWTHLQPMLQALRLTAQVALVGLLIASALGVTAAVLMSRARWLERSLYPYAVVLQTVPILAIVPLVGLWFGFGFTSRVVVCVLIALFPMIANTLFGIQSVDRTHHDLFTLQRASRWARLRKLELPAALPSIFTGLRTSSGLSVIGAIVGDMFFKQGEPGIGTLLDVYRSRLQSEDLFAAIILASLFGVTVFAFFTLVARLAVGSWHASADRP
ncbi:ABC transporter permease [Streptomyces sp. NL15-2K]|uniref:ABC transporter permease n=1 Tax=Streptomyces sp. NL15-2K TaxID=376149 RepID=UPI000FFA9EDA|nr:MULTISPECIES: ABC transporter permease [Actinomycetes]WKX12279.1 ABC transporter permease [Kutzneria buriramensis]GCB46221.1 transmembrane component of hydroxymethylpyrimidine ABC transporter [Streptomyces sp. NL15-2K]